MARTRGMAGCGGRICGRYHVAVQRAIGRPRWSVRGRQSPAGRDHAGRPGVRNLVGERLSAGLGDQRLSRGCLFADRVRQGRDHIVADRPGELPSGGLALLRSEEHTSELQSLMRISYAVFCLKKKKINTYLTPQYISTTVTKKID